MLTYIIPFIILILVVVFIHEYGHYYFARKYGVGVTDFSIGFGQEIFGWNDKVMEPDGRYVGSHLVDTFKFFGDRNVYSQADHERNIGKHIHKEEQDKLFIIKTFISKST